MKKNINLIFLFFMFIFLNECSGYKPIFATTDLQFKISDHVISGDKFLGNKLYSKFNSLSKSKISDPNIKNIGILININKTKKSATKDSAGKILEYKITLNTKVEVTNIETSKIILNKNYISSLNYKVQSQYSDTINIENKTIENLLNNTSREIILNISKNLSLQ